MIFMVVHVSGTQSTAKKYFTLSPLRNKPSPESFRKEEKTRNYVFYGRTRISKLVGGIDFKHLRARKRPFLHVRHKMLGDLKRVNKKIVYGHSVQPTSFFSVCLVCFLPVC